MDNLFDRLNATAESVRSHRDISNGYPLKLQDVSDDKPREWEKTHSDVNVDTQDGGKETSVQKVSGMKEERPSSFVIPKKKRRTTDVLLDVKVSSRDFQHDILPVITKSYRQPHSSTRFVYNQVQVVQNTCLTDAYMEKRRELRGCGYAEKELSDSFAFLCTDIENEEETNKICREGLNIGNSVDSCLGHPKMGVQLCKHADILRPFALNSGYSGYLIVFKVMKGKIKSVMENRSGSHLEPTPNHDCHLSSTTGNDLSSLNQQNLYEATQLYMYEYGDENVRDVPRNVCPIAVVRFTYNESQKDVKSPDMNSPKVWMRSPLSVRPVPSSPQIKGQDQNFVVWSGHLTVKGLYACSVEMKSKAGHGKPARIGKGINITHKMPIAQARKKYLQRITSLNQHHESFWNGYYVSLCELHPVKPEGKSHFQKVMNYLGKHNCVAIRKLEKDVVLLLLTASELTFQLGLTKPHQYPVILYSIFLSRTSRKHGAAQTDPLVQSGLNTASAGLPTTVSFDPCQREMTKPLHINLPLSPSLSHMGLTDNTKHSTVASPSHTFPSHLCERMPPPPSPTKGMRSTSRASPVVGTTSKRWEISSPPPVLVLPAFCVRQPPPPLTPPVMAPTSPIQCLRSPVHTPISPLNHWTLIPPPPPPPTPPPATFTQGVAPDSPNLSQSMDIIQSLYSPIKSSATNPMNCSPSPSKPLQYCLPQSMPVPSPICHQDPHENPRDPRDKSRDPRYKRDHPRSPREHAREPHPGGGFMFPVLQLLHTDPALDGKKSPMSSGPLTSSPQHPNQPPPNLQTPPPTPRHDFEVTRFESPRHFSSYPPKTSLLFSDQIKSEFKKQAKTLESIAQRSWNRSRSVTNQSNNLFSTSSDSESEMSDSEINRIVKQLGVPTDESTDTENSIKGSPTKSLSDVPCIEEVMNMKEILNKSLKKSTEKKTVKRKDMLKQEAEAMRQLLNSVVCDKNRQQKVKTMAAECKSKQQALSVKPMPPTLEKKDVKTYTGKTTTSKIDQFNSKITKVPVCSPSESVSQSGIRQQEQNDNSKGESSKQRISKEHAAKPSTNSLSMKESKKGMASNGQKQINMSDKKSSQPQQEAYSSVTASHMRTKCRSRTSSTSSQNSLGTNEKKSAEKYTAYTISKTAALPDSKAERLKTFAEKHDALCQLQQDVHKQSQKTSSKHKSSTSSTKSVPVIAMDISLPVKADNSKKGLPSEQRLLSKGKNSSNKARSRAYSSSEIENSLGICDEQVSSAPKKAKLDPTTSVEKSKLFSKVNSGTTKRHVPVIDEKQQTNEKKLSFKIKTSKSLLQKDPLSVNKGGKRGLKCGKSSSSSSAKRTETEKRKIKSWVNTNREKCSIEDVLPGLYSSDKSKLGRIPKLSKMCKTGQKSLHTDAAAIVKSTSELISEQSDINTSSSTKQLSDDKKSTLSPDVISTTVQSSIVSSNIQSSKVHISPSVDAIFQDAQSTQAVTQLPFDKGKPSLDGVVNQSAKHIDFSDKCTRKITETRDKGSKSVNITEMRTTTESCLGDPISGNHISQENELIDEVKCPGHVEGYRDDHHHNKDLVKESKDEGSNRFFSDQNVMVNPVPELHFCDQCSQKSSHGSSCSSSRNSSVERDFNTASEKRRKYLRKRDRVESPLDSIMKSIKRSAAAKLRNSPQGWSNIERSRSPGLNSDPAKSTDTSKPQTKFKGKTNIDMEKSLQKKYEIEDLKSNIFKSSRVDDFFFIEHKSVVCGSSNKTCNVVSIENTKGAADITRQDHGVMKDLFSECDHSTIHSSTESGEPIVKNSRMQPKQERSIAPDIIIPGLGDLPLSKVDHDCKRSNIVCDPLNLIQTSGLSSKNTIGQHKAERSITPEVVFPGQGDVLLKDLSDGSQNSNVVLDPLKLANTAEYSKRDRPITPEVIIPGLGDLPFPNEHPSIVNQTKTTSSTEEKRAIPVHDISKLEVLSAAKESRDQAKVVSCSGRSLETAGDRSSCDQTQTSVGDPPYLAGSSEEISCSFVPVQPSGDVSSMAAIAKDDRHVSTCSVEGLQDVSADEEEILLNTTRVVEQAGRELKLRISIPNNLCGDVKLVTLDQTIKQTLHGYRQFSRLTPDESVLMTTINCVIHKKLYEIQDQRHVEDLNGQKGGDVLTKKSPNTPAMAELTRNLSPSLVEFARKHLSPNISDFTRKHDPDSVDAELSDHISDLVSYESWGSNRNTDNLISSKKADKKCSEKVNTVSSKEKISDTDSKQASSASSSPLDMKYVPASAFIPKKGSLDSKAFIEKTRSVCTDASSPSGHTNILPSQSTIVSSGYSSDLSDSSTICGRTITSTPRTNSPMTVGNGVEEKICKQSEMISASSQKSTDKVNCDPHKSSDFITVGNHSTFFSSKDHNQQTEKCENSSSKILTLSKMSNTQKEETASLLLSTKSSETVSSFSPAKSSKIVSTILPSTKSSLSLSSPTKLSEKSGGGPSVVFSPIRLPDGNQLETVSKTLVPESAKCSQVGAIRSDNQGSRKERKAQTHPYTRRRRHDSWSFDIPYRNLQELMRDLTTDTFKQRNVNVPKPQKSKGRIPCRFRNYRFKRSSIPDSLPDSPDDSDEFTAEAIPDFEERKRKADILEYMQISKKEDQENYTAEQSSYSPGATQASRVKGNDDKEKGVENEKENIQTRRLRISKLTSPTKVKDKNTNDTAQQGSNKNEATLSKIAFENGIGPTNNSRKRRISQTCSPSRRRDWRQNRVRHNTGLGETKNSQPIEEETSLERSKENTPTDVQGGKSSQVSSRGSTPSSFTSFLRQGSREYSPSEFFCGTGEGKSTVGSRGDTPTDFTKDVDIPKTSEFLLGLPKVQETLKRKIRIKRVESFTEKGSSLSPGTPSSDDYNNPYMFQPITTNSLADNEKVEGDLRVTHQLKKGKGTKNNADALKKNISTESNENIVPVKERKEKKLSTASTNGNRSECSNNEKITVSEQKISEETGVNENTKNIVKDGNISEEDLSDWIVMDEFHCQEISVTKEPGVHGDKSDYLEDKAEDPDKSIGKGEKLVTNVVQDYSKGQKDVPGNLAEVQTLLPVPGTEEKELCFDDRHQPKKAEEPVKSSGREITDDVCRREKSKLSIVKRKEKDLETENGEKANHGINLCTQGQASVYEEVGLEGNPGDKTILENCDMNISEIAIDHQGADTFVPVIYLLGTKGRKIPWTKELDQSKVTEVVNGDEISYPSSMNKETPESEHLEKSLSTNEKINQGITITYLSGTKKDNPSTLNLDKLSDNPSRLDLDKLSDNPSRLNLDKFSDNPSRLDLDKFSDNPSRLELNKFSDNSSTLELNKTNNNSTEFELELESKEEDGSMFSIISRRLTQEVDSEISTELETPLNIRSTFAEMLTQNSPAYPDTVSSKISQPEILLGTNYHEHSINSNETPNKEMRVKWDNTDTKDHETNNRDIIVEKENAESISFGDSENHKQHMTSSRIHIKKSLYDFEEENQVNTSITSSRLDCSWNFTVEQDKESSESIYGEYCTSATSKISENMKDYGHCKVEANPVYISSDQKEEISSSLILQAECSNASPSSGSCDNLEEKPNLDSLNKDCNEKLKEIDNRHAAVINPVESRSHSIEKNTAGKMDTHSTNELYIDKGAVLVDYIDLPKVGAQHYMSVIGTEEETVPCIGAEEETGTFTDAEDELLQATNTCVLLCHGDVFSSVTGRDEMSSSGQESSQDSTNKCNLSFEAEYRENGENELFEIGEYCADLNYRLDRDMDLGHDIEVEKLISCLEEGKDDSDVLIPCEQFEKSDSPNISYEKCHWKVLKSKLRDEDEESFTKPTDSCTTATGNWRLPELGSDQNIKKPTEEHVLESFSKDTVHFKSNYTSFDLKPAEYSQEESSHDNKRFVPVGDGEEVVPDSQEESDGDEATMVNISDFLKSDVLHNDSQSLNEHLTDSQSSSRDSVKSITTEEIVELPRKVSTPTVSPVADLFGLGRQTPVMPVASQHCTDYVYGMYGNQPKLSSEVPVEDKVEETSECETHSKLRVNLIQNSPLNLSVSSKSRISEGIPGINSYTSRDCSVIADEEVSNYCGTTSQPVTPTKCEAINTVLSCFEKSSPLKDHFKELCPVSNKQELFSTGKIEDQHETSTDISNLPEQTSTHTETGTPPLQSYTDKSLHMAESFLPQLNPIPSSDNNCYVASSQDSDCDERSQGSVPPQDMDSIEKHQGCKTDQGQNVLFENQHTPAISPDVDISVLTLKPECIQAQSKMAKEMCDIEVIRPCTPMNYSSPQPWIMSPPPYVPNFWPYSPPIRYAPNAFFSYRPPLLPRLMNSYRMWQSPFHQYPDYRSIPLQHHGIMSSLNPHLLRWTGAVGQHLQTNPTNMYTVPMFEPRLPLYSSYTYSRLDTNLRGHEQVESSDKCGNAVYSYSHEQTTTPDRHLPSYSNIFMQYVVHKHPVLANVTGMTSPPDDRTQLPVSLTTTSLMTSPLAHLPMVETPSVLPSMSSPSQPAASKVVRKLCSVSSDSSKSTTTDCKPCIITPEHIPLSDFSPNTSPQNVMETPAILPPISTFAKKPEADNLNSSVCRPEPD